MGKVKINRSGKSEQTVLVNKYNRANELVSSTDEFGIETKFSKETQRVNLSETTQNSFACNLRGQEVESLESSDNLRLKTTRQFDVWAD